MQGAQNKHVRLWYGLPASEMYSPVDIIVSKLIVHIQLT